MSQNNFEFIRSSIKSMTYKQLTLLLVDIIERIKVLKQKNKSNLEILEEELTELGYNFEFLNKNNGLHIQSIVCKTAENPIYLDYLKEYLETDSSCINYQDETNGWTALMLASMTSNNKSTNETVSTLIKYGAKIDIKDKNNFDSIYHCLNNIHGNSNFDTLKLLTENIETSYILNLDPKFVSKLVERIQNPKEVFEIIGYHMNNDIQKILHSKYKNGKLDIRQIADLYHNSRVKIDNTINDRAYRELIATFY